MKWLSQLRRRIAVLFYRDRFDRDLEEEIQSHLELQAQEHQENGMAVREAYHAARRQFGNATLLKDQSGDVWGWTWLEDFRRDCGYALRNMARMPTFTAVAVLVLAMGIGASIVIFSIVNSVLLRPLPYKDADRLVQIWETRDGRDQFAASFRSYLEWKRCNAVFESIGGAIATSYIVTEGEFPERVSGASASADLFSTLGIAPALGRGFLPEDEVPGSHRVVVLSEPYWRVRLGSDPGACGRILRLDGEPYTVIGVMPARFRYRYPAGIDLWTPLAPSANAVSRRMAGFTVIGRLKPQLSVAQAQAAMSSLAGSLAKEYPAANGGWGINLAPLHERVVGRVRLVLVILIAAVAFVTLIACVNVASLLLARAVQRSREIAIRTAIGASRGRLARQLLAESTMLALAGGAAGLVLAAGGIGYIRGLVPENVPRADEIAMDFRVCLFALAASLGTGILFGLAPMLQLKSRQPGNPGKETGSPDPARSRWTRGALIVTETALCLVLLTGAGLMVNTLMRMIAADPGFDPQGVVKMEVRYSRWSRRAPQQAVQFFETALERIRTIPGIARAGMSQTLPMGAVLRYPIEIDEPGRASGRRSDVGYSIVAGDYFETMRIPLRAGRSFEPADRVLSPAPAIVSQAFVRRLQPGTDPVGQRLTVKFGQQDLRLQVIGVVGDVKHNGALLTVEPEIYVSHRDDPTSWGELVFRTQGHDPSGLIQAVRAELRALDAGQPIDDIASMEDVVKTAQSQQRFLALLLGCFSAFALVLAATGMYGVIAFSVRRRTREIGIRMALGARRRDVLRMIVGEGTILLSAGVVLGAAVAFAGTRLLSSFLYGVAATDPVTFIAAAALLAGVTLAACWIPARRATRIDPMEALHYE